MTESKLRLLDDFPAVEPATWRALVEKDLKGAPFEKRLVTRLYEGITVQPLYMKQDWATEADASGLPGQAPMTRGSTALPQGSGWQVRQRFAHPDVDATAKQIARELERGVDAVCLSLCGCVQEGNAPCAASKEGLVLDSLAELERALGTTDLSKVPVVLDAGASFFGAAATLIALWKKRGVSPAAASGNLGADPFSALAGRGALLGSAQDALSQVAALAQWTKQNAPNVRAVRVSTAVYAEAGATAVQELAAALATGVAYLAAMESAGLSAAEASAQIEFSLSVGTDQFLEIAKLRAMRSLWSRVLEACSVPAAQQGIKLHAFTSKRVLTQRDPWVNMLRTTVGCFASAVGGADAITIEPFDARLGVSDELGRRVARNTQVVLKEESHLARVVDPMGGCWYGETLTEQLAQKAWEAFQGIMAAGGMLAVLQSGKFAQEIAKVAADRAANVAKRKDPITGVSEFPNVNEAPVALPVIDVTALVAASQRANASAAEAAKSQLAALSGKQGTALLDAAIAALRAGATLVATSRAAARDAAATAAALTPAPMAKGFERLRDAADAFKAKTGARPRVFLANMGTVAQHTARATFTRNFFEAGGFETITNDGFADAAAAAEAFRKSGAPIAVICSTDAMYEQVVASVAPALKAAGAREVVLAGRPGDKEADYKSAGVGRFIFMGCNVEQTLTECLAAQGVLS